MIETTYRVNWFLILFGQNYVIDNTTVMKQAKYKKQIATIQYKIKVLLVQL